MADVDSNPDSPDKDPQKTVNDIPQALSGVNSEEGSDTVSGMEEGPGGMDTVADLGTETVAESAADSAALDQTITDSPSPCPQPLEAPAGEDPLNASTLNDGPGSSPDASGEPDGFDPNQVTLAGPVEGEDAQSPGEDLSLQATIAGPVTEEGTLAAQTVAESEVDLNAMTMADTAPPTASGAGMASGTRAKGVASQEEIEKLWAATITEDLSEGMTMKAPEEEADARYSR
ncbi:MAG: hypothetical protein ACYTGH_14465 [Planctomycetota bacterium]|jgi:hypothetical protein